MCFCVCFKCFFSLRRLPLQNAVVRALNHMCPIVMVNFQKLMDQHMTRCPESKQSTWKLDETPDNQAVDLEARFSWHVHIWSMEIGHAYLLNLIPTFLRVGKK